MWLSAGYSIFGRIPCPRPLPHTLGSALGKSLRFKPPPFPTLPQGLDSETIHSHVVSMMDSFLAGSQPLEPKQNPGDKRPLGELRTEGADEESVAKVRWRVLSRWGARGVHIF